VNLADALGIVSWLKIDGDSALVEPESVSSSGGHAEYWCMADGLEHFWEDESDARWHLLLAVLKSVGHDLDSVMPLDSADDYAGGAVLSFGIVSDFAICLPSLDDMLNDGGLKRQAWQTLCANGAFFH
jgi:hypothetical protein